MKNLKLVKITKTEIIEIKDNLDHTDGLNLLRKCPDNSDKYQFALITQKHWNESKLIKKFEKIN